MMNRSSAGNPAGFGDAIALVVKRLQPGHLAGIGKLMGIIAYALDRRHVRIVKRNLLFTHPHWSREDALRHSRRVFKNMGITFVEICQIPFLSKEDLVSRVRIRGRDNLYRASDNHKGVIFVSGHLGNWEMVHLVVSCFLNEPPVLVARKLDFSAFNRWIHRLRKKTGSVLLDKKGALSRMVRLLKEGRGLGILVDQEPKHSDGVQVDFLGKTCYATPAPALLARRYGLPVYPVFCVRENDMGLTVKVEPPLQLKKTKDANADLEYNIRLITSAIEKAVRGYSDQWFWFHKRWKKHYPYLYWEDLSRRKRRRDKRKERTGSD